MSDTIYVTKYWKARGIIKTRIVEGLEPEGDERYVTVDWPRAPTGRAIFVASVDAFHTLLGARYNVDHRRLKEILRLEKKLERLRGRDVGAMEPVDV